MILESIDINLHIESSIPQVIEAILLLNNKWEEIDEALNTGMFVNLTPITCNVRPYLDDCTLSKSAQYSYEVPMKRIDPTLLLPCTAFPPSGKLEFYSMSMSDLHEMFT